MTERKLEIDRDGVLLAVTDFGGAGPPVLLLHGLAGYAGEWRETASWLSHHHRVVAFDARGHGCSERDPADVSLAAHAADAAHVIEALGLGPVVAIGQSFGGLTALMLAHSRPGIVRAVVMAQASPDGGGSDAEIAEHVGRFEAWLLNWPVPFPSHEAAVEFFGGPSAYAEAWAAGLQHREDGLHPSFDTAVMTRTLREADRRAYWDAWEQLQCPMLVVTAGRGGIPAEDAEKMVARARAGRHVEIADAKHDLHLDRPDEWRAVIQPFLDG